MTNDENPADVIEQAAEAAYKTGIYVNEYAAGQIARALADAGLLADPADRDEQHTDLTPVADIIRNAQAYRGDTGIVFKPESAASDLFAAGWLAGRSERLARERAERRAERAEAEVAELRATLDRVRALADEWDRTLQDMLRVEIDELRAALDGEGEQ